MQRDEEKNSDATAIDDAYKKLKARRGTNLYELGRLYRKASLKLLSGSFNDEVVLKQFQGMQKAFNLLRDPQITKGLMTDYRPAAQKKSDKFIENRETIKR